MLKSYKQILQEAKFNPDLGETIAFEDEVDIKYKGKDITIKPNTEFEVISVSGALIGFQNKDYKFSLSKAEALAYGVYLV